MSSGLGFMTKFFNVVFIVPDRKASASSCKEIKAHKSILANRSDYFAKTFFGHTSSTPEPIEFEVNEEGLQVVRINDVEFDVFDYMIECMYNRPATDFIINTDNYEQLLYAAKKFNFEDFRTKSIDFMTKNLDVSNSVRFWATAKKYHFGELETKAFEKAVGVVDVAFSTDAVEHADIKMWEFVLSSEKFRCTDFPTVLNNVIYWATLSEGLYSTISDIRDLLKPLRHAIKQQYTKLPNPAVVHDLYSIYFPYFKNCTDSQLCTVDTVEDCVSLCENVSVG